MANNNNAAMQKFSKDALLRSEYFRRQQDVMKAVLKDGESYTIAEAEANIKKYMKGQVR